MSSRFIGNAPAQGGVFKDEIVAAIQTAQAIDIAVSYLQMSGWHLLARHLSAIQPSKVRVLTTDQMNITHPAVLDAALQSGFQVRCYRGQRIYHPKVFILHVDGDRQVKSSVILGSANISGSGLENGIEAGMRFFAPDLFHEVARWFNLLWLDTTTVKDITADFVSSYRKRWKTASQARARAQRQLRNVELSSRKPSPREVDILDDVFSTIVLPVGTLGFDHAGNNIRNLSHLSQVLSQYPHLDPKKRSKQRSELRLLGFMQDGDLSELGRRAKQTPTLDRIAALWTSWIKVSDNSTLNALNPRLSSFRRAATRFWQLKKEVRQFFFEKLEDRNERATVQAIELCANGSEVVEAFCINDFRALATLMFSGKGPTEFIRSVIANYRSNKGSRSWTSDDRRTVLKAWRTRS